MLFEELEIAGVWKVSSAIHSDNRGMFREWFKSSEVEQITGEKFDVQQANISTSKRGVIRGIHYSNSSTGQGKWVTCVYGSIWDVVVDIRPDSPTYKKWLGVELNPESGDCLYISHGLGHGFMSLAENSVVSYLLTSAYSPTEEFEINPFDPELNIEWPLENSIVSDKDKLAPSFENRHR